MNTMSFEDIHMSMFGGLAFPINAFVGENPREYFMGASKSYYPGPSNPTVNAEGLHETLEYIARNPDSWKQDYWAQDNTRCFAGRAVELHVGHLVWNKTLQQFEVGGQKVHVPCKARDILGLTDRQAGRLFYACNSFDELVQLVGNYTRPN